MLKAELRALALMGGRGLLQTRWGRRSGQGLTENLKEGWKMPEL